MGDSRGSMRSVGILVVTAFVLVCTAETSREDLDGAITMEELTQSARERQELAEFTEKLSASAAVGETQSVASSAALEAQGTSAGPKDPAVVKQAIKLIEKSPHQAFKLVKDLERKLKTKDKTAITSQKRTKSGTEESCPWKKLAGL